MEEFCDDDNSIAVVHWKDSRAVTIASTCTGCESVTNIRRWCKIDKEYISVPYLAVVQTYKKFMGDVDICDLK